MEFGRIKNRIEFVINENNLFEGLSGFSVDS